MKRTLLFLALAILFSYNVLSQGVAINNDNSNADASAMLDIKSANKGLLIPRVDIADLNTKAPVTSPSVSLLVYNTNTTTGVGYYYWDGTKWVRLTISDDLDFAWKTTGNAGTNPNTNFIGTTDNQALSIRTNNQIKLRITTQGQIETINTGNSVFIGRGAGRLDDLSNNYNVFVGYRSGDKNTSGESNVAIGTWPLQNNTTGSNNTAIGVSALDQNTIGNNNIGIGSYAGRNITTGSNNIIIGYNIEAPNETGDNQLNIGNLIYGTDIDGTGSTISSGNIGIGVASPAERLHINGSVRGNQNGALRINTGSGYVDIGPKNTTWSHFSTDRSRFFFNKPITVDGGAIGSYDENLLLQTSGNTRITVLNSNGNVGVGTTNPNAKLEVSDPKNSGIILNLTDNNNNTGEWGHKAMQIQTQNIIQSWIATNGAAFFRNRVGIGAVLVTNTSAKLKIGEHTNSGTMLHLADDNNPFGDLSHKAMRVTTQGVAQSWIATNGNAFFRGNVGIGIQSPSAKLHVSGNFTASGTKSATVRTEDGPKTLYCQESPENWFEDFGNSKIYNGKAVVNVEKDFVATVTINPQHPMKVFITPNGNMGNWWVEKKGDSFIVYAPNAQDGTEFDFRVVAKRKGYEDLRLKDAPGAYTDKFLYPSENDVPAQYREAWIKANKEFKE